MSEIQPSESRNKRGGRRSKKLSTRIDLTPMVDLGFLLITFFIFTTTMSEARAMKLIVPDDTHTDKPSLAPASKTISLILGADDVIYYYYGFDNRAILQTNYAASGIRTVLQQKIKTVRGLFGKTAETIVLIKPTPDASYKNLVAILDEMLINDVSKYVLMDVSKEETNLLPLK